MFAAAMTLGLASCVKEDNGTPVQPEEPTEPQVLIKEVNTGGCKTEANKSYLYCKAITLYNNTSKAITLKNLGIGNAGQGNADAVTVSKNYDEKGNLSYQDAGWTPVWSQLWYIPEITIQPFSDAVIAVNSAIDHTTATANAFNLANSDYYAMYDTSVKLNEKFYVAPYEGIPTSHYFKCINLYTASSWPGSITCPAIIVFTFPEGVDPVTYCDTAGENIWYNGGEPASNKSNICVKIPNEWILDGFESFTVGKVEKSLKRIPNTIDSGYGLYNSLSGYSAYRNVDQKGTEALSDNAGKLVYNYAGGAEGTTDPSGIDAAASVKNGAKIIYQDTNNSTSDFHVREAWSLK